MLHKDETLDRLAEQGNIAQFVSFRPRSAGISQSYSRVLGYPPNHLFDRVEGAILALLGASSDGSVNIRSYVPESPRSKEFIYGLKSVDEVTAALHRLAESDLHLIVNETIDVSDGGVSGVLQGDVVEFAPDDTPRCVEKPGVASLSFDVAMKLLHIVYGFRPALTLASGTRVEFSIHPKPRGYCRTHTIIWEYEENVPGNPRPSFAWPNRFSRHIGDKAFGLIIAHVLGLHVPRTTVIGRRVAPFTFGEETGSHEFWTRTCPAEPQPGLYTTVKGWVDPFQLVAVEDKSGSALSSVLCQAAVTALYSGAAVTGRKSQVFIEGRRGEGGRFMLGLDPLEILPDSVTTDVWRTLEAVAAALGAIRLEWVFDSKKTWVVQLHKGATVSDVGVIVPGNAKKWVRYHSSQGLDHLRALLEDLPDESGVIVEGSIGLTSHVADLLRKTRRPAKLESQLRH